MIDIYGVSYAKESNVCHVTDTSYIPSVRFKKKQIQYLRTYVFTLLSRNK